MDSLTATLLCSTTFLVAIQRIDSTFFEAVAVAFSLYTFLVFVHRIGEWIALLECICFIAALEILLIPAITYWVFPASMPIESGIYFSYALPAYLAFYVGINWFNHTNYAYPHWKYIQSAIDYLNDKQAASSVLLLIGLGGFLVKAVLPTAPNIIGTLPAYCLFISAFYAYYSQGVHRHLLIGFAFVILLANTVRTGMFGDLFFWLLLLAIFVVVGLQKRLTIRKKIIVTSSAFALLLLIQSVKGEYRHNTWGYQRTERSGDASLLASLLVDRLANPEKLLNTGHFFASCVRFNQGIMIGSAMTKVPLHESYAHGEVLLSFIYPFVPRFIWPDKPQTGGYENIRRFTTLPQFENTSINLSPLGEGYVNFGYGGILFSGLYGLVLGGCFTYVFGLAERIPTVILWLPMLYIGSLTMETDVLSTWGSLVNSAIFIALLFWALKQIGIDL